MGFEAGVFRKSWLRRGVRVKARARNVNVSRGAGSCQSTPLRLAGSIGQIMLVLPRSCALLKCFWFAPIWELEPCMQNTEGASSNPEQRCGVGQGMVLVVQKGR